ncbi:MAG: Na/Pi cotransporter family protein [Oscillospiraceae bacterium]|nr:Na/Pi cotransporter family protein [Oscillospiraceae bacterium]
MVVTAILSLLCGLVLFLYGVMLMGDGLNQVAGGKLEAVLYRLTSHPLKGIALGAAVTAVIQSSTATSIIAIGFISSGMMSLRQAASIILGSILGTSVTGWIVSLSFVGGGSSSGVMSVLTVANLTAVLACVGIYLRKFQKTPMKNSVGTILLGFTILMTGMDIMSASVSPLKENAAFISLLTNFSNPVVGILVGMVFTAIIQSSAAAIGILQALSVTGAITFSAAFPIVLGVAVGGAIPVLLSALGADINARRTALMHLAMDILGAVLCGILFYAINAFAQFGFYDKSMNAVDIALINTLFRLVTVILLTPAIGLLEKLVRRIIPDPAQEPTEEDAIDALLEDRFLAYPTLALSQCHMAIGDMAACAFESIGRVKKLLHEFNESGFAKVEQLETRCDLYEDRVGTYLMKATRRELNEAENRDVTLYLHALSDFERISDHAMNIAHTARQMEQKSINYSPDAQRELGVIERAVDAITDGARETFDNKDLTAAQHTVSLAAVIEELCETMRRHHVERLRAGICTLEQGITFNDLISNYEEISERCKKLAYLLLELAENGADAHAYHQRLSPYETEEYAQYSAEYAI